MPYNIDLLREFKQNQPERWSELMDQCRQAIATYNKNPSIEKPQHITEAEEILETMG